MADSDEYSPIDHLMPHDMARSVIRYVIGPEGRHLTLADLPSQSTQRRVILRKAEVVVAVRGRSPNIRRGLWPLDRSLAFDRSGLNSLATFKRLFPCK